MTYITYAPIDRQFSLLKRDLEIGAEFNGIDPLEGIDYGFSLASRFPLAENEPDIRYGSIDAEVEDNPEILLRVISEDEYLEALEQEELALYLRDIPKEVTAAQAQVALFDAGYLDQVEELIASHPYPKVRIWWRAARNWERSNPYIYAVALELGLSDEQVDNLFKEAAKVAQ